MKSPQTTHTPPRPFLTVHALERCQQMTLTRSDVVGVLRTPEVTYPSPASYGIGRMTSVGGRLAVIHTANLEVITVLWHGRESRDRAD